VGYNGFRAATQIDPIWNLYLLALLVEVGPEIESARLPVDKERVFSYRFKVSDEDSTLFDRSVGWMAFHRAALAKAQPTEFIVSTDIPDFYPPAYHPRIENALKQATGKTEVVRRVMAVLKALSGGTSYGLPVGGNAARFLAELLLNRTDKLLVASGVDFCRFVDDYFLFANSSGAAQERLVQLSERLLTNEGLTLTKAKTRVMSRSEFIRSSPAATLETPDSQHEAMAREFLGIRLAYDPYSPTADVDYSTLRDQLAHFDITGMLARELRKSRVDESLTRQLVKSIRYLTPELRDAAVRSIIGNFSVLYPIFPTVAIAFRQLLGDLSDDVKQEGFETIRKLISQRSHIFLVPANLSFAIHLLAHDRAEETDALLVQIYTEPQMMIKRDVVLAMARRGGDYWLSERLKGFAQVSPWERRALIVASYVLGDEGRHWRDGIRRQLQLGDQQFLEWVGSKNNGRVWELPL